MKQLFFTLLLPLALLSCGKTPEASGETPGGETTLAVPADVRLHSATETSLTFQWKAVAGAQSYLWKLTLEGQEFKTGTSSQRNCSADGLTPGTTYAFSVCAKAGEVMGAWSEAISAKTEGTPPDPSAQLQCVDAPLVLTLDAAPVLGTSGRVTVYEKGGTEVDRIDLADLDKVNIRPDGVMVPKEQMTGSTAAHTFLDVLTSGGKTRMVHYTPLRISGNNLVIRLHTGKLDFGKEYYVTVDESVCGKAVAAGEWTFATKAAPSASAIGVNPDGSADFCTLQRALQYAAEGAVITLADGTYPELLYLRDKKNLTVKGTSRDGSVIAYPNAEAYYPGSSGRPLWLVENCDNLVLQDLTIHNTYGEQGQAECIYFNSGSNAHKLVIENCALLSLQDTFQTKGEVYVHGSLIAGNVDFIWGGAKACLFEDCEIRCLPYQHGGFVIQARVPSASNVGFVFLNCRITAGEGAQDGSVYLARANDHSQESSITYDNVTYINCQMASVIAQVGWYTSPAPNPATPSATAGWKEYGTTGVSTAARNAYGKTLTAEEAAAYSSRQAVLGW